MKPAGWITLFITLVMVTALTVPAPAQDVPAPVVAQSASPRATEPSAPNFTRSLIGEWSGEFTTISRYPMELSITAVEENTFTATAYISSGTSRGLIRSFGDRKIIVKGAVNGMTLTFSVPPGAVFTLSFVEEKRMTVEVTGLEFGGPVKGVLRRN